jgi:hypothetical protein
MSISTARSGWNKFPPRCWAARSCAEANWTWSKQSHRVNDRICCNAVGGVGARRSDHQANPHVHISVRAESKHGKRLNPRKADLHRWRETFAAKLRKRGIEAEATRGVGRRYPELWQVKAGEDGRLLRAPRPRSAALPATPAEMRRARPGESLRPFLPPPAATRTGNLRARSRPLLPA